MNRIYALLDQFGLFTRKPAAPDAFDLRLRRIGTREAQRMGRPVLFKLLPQLLEASARSLSPAPLGAPRR